MQQFNPNNNISSLIILLTSTTLIWWKWKNTTQNNNNNNNKVLFILSIVISYLITYVWRKFKKSSSNNNIITNNNKHQVITISGKTLLKLGIQKLASDFVGDEDFGSKLFRLARDAYFKTKQGVGFFDISPGDGKIFEERDAVVIVSRPGDAAKILMSSVRHHMGMKRVQSTVTFLGKRALFAIEDEEWKSQRNIMKNFLSKSTEMHRDFERSAFAVARALNDHIKFSSGTQAPIVDVHAILVRFHISGMCRALTGDDLGFFPIGNSLDFFVTSTTVPSQHINNNNSSSTSSVNGTTISSSSREEIISAFEYFLTNLPSKPRNADPEFIQHSKALMNIMKNIVEGRLQNDKYLKSDRPIDGLLIHYLKVDHLSREDAIEATSENLLECLFAGYTTVAVGMSFTLFYLCTNPIWWAELQKEVDSILWDFDFSRTTLETTSFIDSKPEAKLLNAVFLESLRLVPPTAFTARLLEKEVTLECGITLPPQTDVFIPIVWLATCPDWGSDCNSFNPKRFLLLASNSSSNNSSNKIPPPLGAFIPFGLGPRSCIGEFVAKSEASIMLSVLIHFFAFDLAPGSQQTPKWSGFGVRPYDKTLGKVAMNLKVTKRRLQKSSAIIIEKRR
jgi:cytochrome P450